MKDQEPKQPMEGLVGGDPANRMKRIYEASTAAYIRQSAPFMGYEVSIDLTSEQIARARSLASRVRQGIHVRRGGIAV